MRTSDQYSNRPGGASTCVERIRHRTDTAPVRRQGNAWLARNRAEGNHAVHTTESLRTLCCVAFNGAAPSPAGWGSMRVNLQGLNSPPDERGIAGCERLVRQTIADGRCFGESMTK